MELIELLSLETWNWSDTYTASDWEKLTHKKSIDLSCVATRCCASLHSQHFFMLAEQKDTSKEESSVKVKIFIGLVYHQAKLPGLNHTRIFPFEYLDYKVWNISRNP